VQTKLATDQPLWLHAVSVGEVQLVARLAEHLQRRLPGQRLVVSTTTTTGMAALRRHLPDEIEKIYYPLDLRRCVRRSLAVVRPRAMILVEAEIWPNFLWHAFELRVPVLLVNARVSERSTRRYRLLAFLFRPLFAGFDLVACASPTDASRLRAVGCRAEALEVVGNLKYDLAPWLEDSRLTINRWLRAAGVGDHPIVLLGGSTHPGEERILGRLYAELRRQFPQLFLVVVPRHVERTGEVCRDLASLGLRLVRRSELDRSPADPHAQGKAPCDALVVDSTGELRAFYTRADVVFVGKSLTARGGQNPIEPAAAGCAIVTGPHMQNFTQVMADFLSAEAVLQVRNEAELRSVLQRLLANPDDRRALGERAQRVVEAGRGALERTVDILLPPLSGRSAAAR
jgi:3-deoxy-D-manno-octulosonic-acid transferase